MNPTLGYIPQRIESKVSGTDPCPQQLKVKEQPGVHRWKNGQLCPPHAGILLSQEKEQSSDGHHSMERPGGCHVIERYQTQKDTQWGKKTTGQANTGDTDRIYPFTT